MYYTNNILLCVETSIIKYKSKGVPIKIRPIKNARAK